MQALAVIGATTIHPAIAPKTAGTGGTSKSDPNAGSAVDASPIEFSPITTADKAGAGIFTVVCAAIIVGGSAWLIM